MSNRLEKNIVKSDVMERPVRRSVNLPSILLAGGKKHKGFITNISAKGVGMFVINTTFPDSTIDCTKGSVLRLEVQSPLGVYVVLQCRIKWLRIKKASSRDVTTSMGMEVVDPAPSFIKLFNSLT